MSRITDTPGLTDYLTSLAGQDETLARVNRETGELPQGMMQSRPDQGALLTFLARLVEARGGAGGRDVHRLRGDLHRPRAGRGRAADLLRGRRALGRRRAANLEAAGVADRVDGRGRPGGRSLARLPDEPHVDFAYVDADKTGYPGYYEAIVPRLRAGGLLVLDNMLLSGRVVDPHDDTARTMAASTSGSPPTSAWTPRYWASPTA